MSPTHCNRRISICLVVMATGLLAGMPLAHAMCPNDQATVQRLCNAGREVGDRGTHYECWNKTGTQVITVPKSCTNEAADAGVEPRQRPNRALNAPAANPAPAPRPAATRPSPAASDEKMDGRQDRIERKTKREDSIN